MPTARPCYPLVGAVARSVAHSLGNPLTGLCLTLDLMAPELSADHERKYLARAQHLGSRICEIKDLLSALGGAVRGAAECVAVAPLLAVLAEQFTPGPPYVLRCEVHAGAESVWGYPVLLRHALAALLRNAVDAAPDGCTIVLRARPHAGGTRLEVEDDGPGVAPALREKIFVVPCSGRPHSAGFGLLMVGMIVEQVHRGHAQMLPAGRGAHFSLDVPGREDA